MQRIFAMVLVPILVSSVLLTGCAKQKPIVQPPPAQTEQTAPDAESVVEEEDEAEEREMDPIAEPKAVITYFFNPDCPHCEAVAPMVENVKNRYGDDVAWIVLTKGEEEFSRLAEEWGIEGTPTWVIQDANGQEIGRLMGSETTEGDFDVLLDTLGVTPIEAETGDIPESDGE